MVLFEVGPGIRGGAEGPLPLRAASLRADRERAARRTSPPDHWVILTDEAGEEVLYWAPVAAPTLVRSTDPEEPVRGQPQTLRIQAREAVVAVALPFHPRGRAMLYPAEGRREGIAAGEVVSFGSRLAAPFAADPGGGP
jgi:hypothetical protein